MVTAHFLLMGLSECQPVQMPLEVCFSETSLKHVSPQCSVSLVLFSVVFWKLCECLTRLLCYCTRLQCIVLHWLPLTGLGCTNSGILFTSEKHVKTFLLRA